jgi:hypothetical protein
MMMVETSSYQDTSMLLDNGQLPCLQIPRLFNCLPLLEGTAGRLWQP